MLDSAAMSDETKRHRFGWPHALAVVAGLAILVAGLVAVLVLRSAGKVGERVVSAGKDMLAEVEEIARAFRTGTITTTFISYATQVSGSNYLQFATLDQVELFQRTDSATALWGRLDLPDVVVEATAEVQYTYYLDLNGRWSLELDGDRIRVIAPEIQFNRPALDPSTLSYEIRQDSVLRDADVAVEKLRSGLSTMSQKRAVDNIPLVREIGRRKTEEFVANWLFRDFGESAQRYDVRVVFADEVASPGTVRTGEPEPD